MTTTHARMKNDFLVVVTPWLRDPITQLKRETVALSRCFFIHSTNNNFRKLTLLVLLGVWVAVSLGIRTGSFFGTIPYTILTALVFTIIGRQWGLEISGITPQISITDGGDERPPPDDDAPVADDDEFP